MVNRILSSQKPIIWLGIFIFGWATSLSQAQGDKKESPKLKVERQVLIEEEAGGLVAKLDLGDLPPGTDCDAKLELLNNSAIGLPIKKMETTCKCIRVRTDGEEIPSGGSLFFDFSISTPKDSPTDSPVQLFNIYYSDENCISVYVRYRFSGLIGFKDAVAFHTTSRLGATEHEFEVPIMVTEPVTLKSLVVTASGELSRAKTSLHQKAENQYLRCKIELDPSSPTVQVGAIELGHKESGKKAQISIVVQPAGGISIAPAKFRFREVERSDSQVVFSASAIVSVDKSLLSYRDEEKTIELPVNFDIQADAGSLEPTVVQLSNGVYRINLKLMVDQGDEKKTPTKVTVTSKPGGLLIRKEIPIGFDSKLLP